MKTHELQKALVALAKSLKSLPDVEVEELPIALSSSSRMSNETIAVGLTTLMALSDIDKGQWLNFILENNFPIEIRPRDASRDILGKLLTYLQNNKDARNRLAHSTRSEKSTTSPELQRALSILLRT